MQRNQLAHGELNRIVIGTVVASGPRGITADEVAEKMNSWGHNITKHQVACCLVYLATEGKIDRISRGRYKGV